MPVKRLCGLIFFSVGFGMSIMVFVSVSFCSVLAILLLMLIGYYLFCCGK